VLSKRVAGKTNRVIGKMLNLSMKIVETHRAAGHAKAGTLFDSRVGSLCQAAGAQGPAGCSGRKAKKEIETRRVKRVEGRPSETPVSVFCPSGGAFAQVRVRNDRGLCLKNPKSRLYTAD